MPATRKKSSPLVRVISSKVAFRGPVFSVMTDEVEEPGNVRARRDVIRHSGSIVVLPLDDSGRTPLVLLERQYRYAAGRRMWELPAGRVDPGENHLAAAKRELIEETGYTASRWQKALFFYVSPGFLDESMTVYWPADSKKVWRNLKRTNESRCVSSRCGKPFRWRHLAKSLTPRRLRHFFGSKKL